MNPADIDAVARTAVAEAGGESPQGQLAVVHTILNRANQAGATPSDVVAAPHQFTSWSNGSAQGVDTTSPAYQRARALVQDAMSGKAPDPTGGAVNFINPSLQKANGDAMPAWAGDGGQRIGNHVFYKGTYSMPATQSRILSADALDKVLSKGQPDQSVAAGAPMASAQPQAPAAPGQPGSGGSSMSADNVDALLAGAGIQKPPPPVLSKARAADAQGAKGLNLSDLITGNNPSPTPGMLEAQRSAAMTRAKVSAMAGPNGQGVPLESYANAATFGLLPVIQGGFAAAGQAGTDLYNKATGSHVNLPYGNGASAGDAFQAVRQNENSYLDQYAKDHPILNTGANLAGFISGGAGKLVTSTAGTLERLAASAAPKAVAKFAPQAGRVGALALGNAAQTAGGDISQEKSLADIAGDTVSSAALSVPFGVAGEAASPFINKALSPLTRHAALEDVQGLIRPAVMGGGGALVGAGLAGATGHDLKEGALAGGTLGLGFSGDPRETVKPSDYDTALDIVAERAHPGSADPHNDLAAAMAQAHPEGLAAESLGPHAEKVFGATSATGASKIADAIDARSQPEAVNSRISDKFTDEGLPDPATAHADVTKATEAAQRDVAPQYRAVLKGEGYSDPQLDEFLSRREVQPYRETAEVLARSNQEPTTSRNPDKDFEAADRHNAPPVEEQAGQDALGRPSPLVPAAQPGQNVPVEVLNRFRASGGVDPEMLRQFHEEHLVQQGDPAAVQRARDNEAAAAQKERDAAEAAKPDTVPSDHVLDRTKKALQRTAYDSEALDNTKEAARGMGKELSDILRRVIPGYADLMDKAGDYLSNRQAFERGQAAFDGGKNGERPHETAARLAKETPAEIEFGQRGFLSRIYDRMSGQMGKANFKPGELLNDRMKALMEAYFGKDKAARIIAHLEKEHALHASGKAAIEAAKKGAPKQTSGEHLAELSAALGGEKSLGGALAGLGKGVVLAAGRNVVNRALGGKLTPQVREAVSQILSKPAATVAQEMAARSAKLKEIGLDHARISKSLSPVSAGLGVLATQDTKRVADHAFSDGNEAAR